MGNTTPGDLSPLNQIASLIAEQCGARSCAIYEYHDDGEGAFLLVAYFTNQQDLIGAKAKLTRPTPTNGEWRGMSAYVGFTGRDLIAVDCRAGVTVKIDGQSTKVVWDLGGKSDTATKSFLGVPLRRDGQITGLVRLTRADGDNPFDDRNRSELARLEPYIGPALALERSRGNLVEGLMGVGDADDLQRCYERVVELAGQLVHGDTHRAALFLCRPEEPDIFHCVAPSKLCEETRPYRATDTGLTPHVLSTGEHLLTPNLKHDCAPGGRLHDLGHQSKHAETGAATSNSWLGVPIKNRHGQVIGAIRVSSAKRYAFFQPDVETLRALADKTAWLIRNRTRLEERDALFDQLVDTSPYPIVHVNQVGMVRQANAKARELFGDAMEQGQSIVDAAYGGEKQLARATQRALKAKGENPNGLHSHYLVCFRRLSNGRHVAIPGQLNALPVRVGGKLQGSIGILRDLRGPNKLNEVIEFGSKRENGITSDRAMKEAITVVDVIKNDLRMHPLDDPDAPPPEPVLIQGGTGTGKELIVAAIQTAIDKNRDPITVNCAAIAGELIDTELFGHAGGAYTSASAQPKPGIFDEVDGRTLFLDEIHHLSKAAQAKILRAVDKGKFRPVGATEEKPIGKMQLVSATNRDLSKEVKEGRFLPDLLERLSGYQMRLPVLRERKADIMQLAMHFLDKERRASLANKGSTRQREPLGFTSRAVQALMGYDWPGNVRELRRAIAVARRFFLGDQDLKDNDRLIRQGHLPLRVRSTVAKAGPGPSLFTEGPVADEKAADQARILERLVEAVVDVRQQINVPVESASAPSKQDKLAVLMREQPDLRGAALKDVSVAFERRFGEKIAVSGISKWRKKTEPKDATFDSVPDEEDGAGFRP